MHVLMLICHLRRAIIKTYLFFLASVSVVGSVLTPTVECARVVKKGDYLNTQVNVIHLIEG